MGKKEHRRMAKEQNRWGEDSLHTRGGNFHRRTVSGRWPRNHVNAQYLTDGTRAVRISEELMNTLKTRVLLGNSTSFRVSNLSLYYSAQISVVDLTTYIAVGNKRLKGKAVMPFRGTWEFTEA